MKAKLVRIGNSRGVRLSKAVIEEAGLGQELEVAVEGDAVVIRSAVPPRQGWAEDARKCSMAGNDGFEEWDTAISDGDWQ